MSDDPKAKPPMVPASRIGADFAASVLGCLGLGWMTDRMLGSGPWGLLLMLVIGFGVGIYQVWRALNRNERDRQD